MSTNYHWHKQQANDRVQARLREAEEHRRAKQANGRSTSPFVLKLIQVLVGVIVAIWLLTSCAANDDHVDKEAVAAAHGTGLIMADRIHFQDELDSHLEDETASGQQAVQLLAQLIPSREEERRTHDARNKPEHLKPAVSQAIASHGNSPRFFGVG